MKLFIYSDVHISRTSSILPISNNSKYTYRQQMIIDTAQYMSQIIKEQNPDIILNLGDTFDQHTITSYDVNTASKFFEQFKQFNIPHYVLVGNHEMINQDFNAITLLNNIEGITVISEPCSLDLTNLQKTESIKVAFLPYCDFKQILEFPEGQYLFSHQDIEGSSVRADFNLPEGISPNELKKIYKLVFNGHIHKPSIFENIVNVGSCVTHSFSDDDTTTPQFYIFDTNTMNLQTYKPNVCPLFRKLIIKKDLSELEMFVNNLSDNFKYILHIICPFEIKDSIRNYLNNNPKILNSRINVKVNKDKQASDKEISEINLQPNIDIKQTFKTFLDKVELKVPLQIYLDVLDVI